MPRKKKVHKVRLSEGQQTLGAVLLGTCPRCHRLLNWTLTGDFPLRHTASCCDLRFNTRPPQ